MQQTVILVVDDEPDLQQLINLKFRKKISTGEYIFHFARNGAEALDIISKDESITLILTDINMPVMDGLTLLSRLNDLDNRLLRSVIVSAYGDMENIRIAMNRGAYDFITKPINLNDLEITIEKSLKEIENYKQALLNRDKLIAFQQELDIAASIQTSILPKTFPAFPERKEFDICARMIPAKEVGGDFYDYFLIDKNRLGVIIGDVSGKGIASALLMAVCKTLLKATAYRGMPVDNVLSELNDILFEESPSHMFVTLFYGVLDTRNGRFEYSNGGHNSPYVISTNGDIKQLENIGGLILGIMRDIEFESNAITLQQGDSILFYTDGITEAFNCENEEFNEERLEKTLSENLRLTATEQIANVIKCVKSFSDNSPQSDDITCMMLKYLKH
ncbi:MAG: SpoIIE family protein phosphatase [bacterium]